MATATSAADPLIRLLNQLLPGSSLKKIRLTVLLQLMLVSVAAFLSQLLVFDSTRVYIIDPYDAIVWGIVVTQLATLTLFVTPLRLKKLNQVLQLLACLGGLALGLTLAAILFLWMGDWKNRSHLWAVLQLAPGYWLVVFIFLLSLFLQLRVAVLCCRAALSLFKPPIKVNDHSMITQEVVASPLDADENNTAWQASSGQRSYAMIDIFAFTGLAAVTITAYHTTLNLLSEGDSSVLYIDRDTLRLLALFYIASTITLGTFGCMFLVKSNWLRFVGLATLAISMAVIEIQLQANPQIRLRFPVDHFTALIWNVVICLFALLQFAIVKWLRAEATSTQQSPVATSTTV